MAQKLAQLMSRLRNNLSNEKYVKGLLGVISQYLLFPLLCWLALEGISNLLPILTNQSLNIIGTFFLPLAQLYFVYRLIALFITLFLGQDIYVSVISRFLFPLFLTYGIIQFIGLFTDLSLLSRTIVFTVSGTSLTVRSLFIISLGLYFWFAGINGAAKFLRQLMVEKLMIEQETLDAYFILIRYFLVGLGVFLAFRELNLDSTAIAAISGGLAVGIGFGLKDILTNFISGTILLFERSIRPGDFIEYNGEIGRVEEINLRATTIKTIREIEFVIPNQHFLASPLTSYTRKTRRVRYLFPVEISCRYEPETITNIILEGLRQDSNILVNLTSTVLLKELGIKNVYFVVVWIEDHYKVAAVRSNVYKRVLNALSRHGIELDTPIPYSIDMIEDDHTFDSKLAELNPNLLIPSQADFFTKNQSSEQSVAAKNNRKSNREKSHQIALVEDSFAKIKPHSQEFAATFYQTLFEKKPKLRPLFRNTNMDSMGKKMFDFIDLTIKNLEDPILLQLMLKKLGAQHKNFGVVEQYYPYVCETLMEAFAQYIPDDWTPEVEQAWSNIFQAITQIMVEGANSNK